MNKIFKDKKALVEYAKEIFGADSFEYNYLMDIQDLYTIWLLENVLAGFIVSKKRC
jgi:hypothetical protein